MSDIILDLKDSDIFESEKIELNNKVTFIFGKNGTGKTTLTNMLKENASSTYDTRVFQGFEGVVGEKKRLNAVILGERNNEIDIEIEIKTKEILNIEEKIKQKESNIQKSEESHTNLWARLNEKKNELNFQNKKISDFFTKSAAEIKNKNNPQIAKTSYNKNHFEQEISYAKALSEDEVNKLKDTLKTTVKVANKLSKPSIKLEDLLKQLNGILTKKVEPKIVINEFIDNKEKELFAAQGMKVHKAGDKCAFCGNDYSKERLERLSLFFSADETDDFRNQINEYIDLIRKINCEINILEIESSSFYPEKLDEIEQIKIDFDLLKNDIKSFLDIIILKADEKSKYLFEKRDGLNIAVPTGLDEIIGKYNKLVDENNKSDLSELQNEAREQLRFNEIKIVLDEFKYDTEIVRKEELQKAFDEVKKESDNEKDEIIKLKKEVISIEENINYLRAETQSEKILADEINKKLELYVNFNLEYLRDEQEKGYYQVRCKHTQQLRDIEQLSTGEKNIIAFLYFIQKLKEIRDDINSLPKLVIFDDPMNSNDDAIQYLIIEELDRLISEVDDNDKVVLMTHNSHFYLNAKYKYRSYKKNTYIRLVSNGFKTSCVHLTDEREDFKTNYESLWYELRFLYDNPDISESMLLNPIRRIIETFVKFNGINKTRMLGHVLGAEKLFNVNSHSIDDLEAELNGIGKEEIMKIMEKCFKEENTLEHYNMYWKSC